MTIRNAIPVAHHEMELLETCAREAPHGTYEDAKKLDEFFRELFSHMKSELQGIGLKLPNDDRYREIEAAIYAMLGAANPEATLFAVAEGFGEAIQQGGEVRARVLRQAADNVKFLKGLK